MISRDEIVGPFQWFDVKLLTNEVIRTRNMGLSLWMEYSLRASIKRAVKDSSASQRFLTDSASLFSTALLLVSLAEHFKGKSSCRWKKLRWKADTFLNRPQLGGAPPRKQSTCETGRAEKPLNTSSTPRQSALQFIHIWPRRFKQVLCPRHFISSYLWPITEVCTVLTFVEYNLDQQARQRLWKILFSTNPLCN